MIKSNNISKIFDKYCKDKDHAYEVEKYALMIFDAFNNSILNFEPQARDYLSHAAKLHDIGYTIEKKSHHKHAMKIIIDEGIDGFNDEENLIIANIARYHRGSTPDETRHDMYKKLSNDNKQLVKQLSSFLRIADGLDKPHKNLVLRMRVQETPECFNLYIKTVGFKPNLKMAEKKKDLFEHTFGKPLNFIFE